MPAPQPRICVRLLRAEAQPPAVRMEHFHSGHHQGAITPRAGPADHRRLTQDDVDDLVDVITSDHRDGGEDCFKGNTADIVMFLDDYIAAKQGDLWDLAYGPDRPKDPRREKALAEHRFNSGLKLRDHEHQLLREGYVLPVHHYEDYQEEYARLRRARAGVHAMDEFFHRTINTTHAASDKMFFTAARLDQQNHMKASYACSADGHNLVTLNEILHALYDEFTKGEALGHHDPPAHEAADDPPDEDGGFDDSDEEEDEEIGDALEVIRRALVNHGRQLRHRDHDHGVIPEGEYV